MILTPRFWINTLFMLVSSLSSGAFNCSVSVLSSRYCRENWTISGVAKLLAMIQIVFEKSRLLFVRRSRYVPKCAKLAILHGPLDIYNECCEGVSPTCIEHQQECLPDVMGGFLKLVQENNTALPAMLSKEVVEGSALVSGLVRPFPSKQVHLNSHLCAVHNQC